LAVAAGASSAALLVRYVGIAFILAAVIALVVLDRQRNLRSRLRRAGIFAGIAVAPTALFAAWARLDGGGSPTSKLYSQAIDLRAPFDRFADYVLPLSGPHALRFLIVVLMLVLVVIGAVWGPGLPGASPEDDHNARYLMQLGLLYVGTYVLFVVFTALLFDLAVPIDARIFAPVRALWYAVLLAVAYRSLVRVVSSVGTVAIIGALAALLVMANWSTTRRFLQDRPAVAPKQTSVAQAIIRIPRDALIVSNAPDAVYDMSGSGSIALPFLSGPPTPEYERSMQQVVELFERRGGYLALVRFPGNPISMRPELQRSLKMHLIAQSPAHQPTAQLYEIPRQASTSGIVTSSP
jgi:4-amino-4-deoxy-L-arabinose transferase-like glycosyltransferase